MPDMSTYRLLEIAQLVPFAKQPFPTCKGQRLLDMIESISAVGVLEPILVRPTANERFEILSGHSRVAAAGKAGLSAVPAIVREGVTDEQALLIASETNLVRRSLADLSHSERADALESHHRALGQTDGYRADLLAETQSLLAKHGRTGNIASGDKNGEANGLTGSSMAQALCVQGLTQEIKDLCDTGAIALRIAIKLSLLRDSEQRAAAAIIAKNGRITIAQANSLRDASARGKLDDDDIRKVFEPGFFPPRIKPVVLSSTFLKEFFNEFNSEQEIEDTLAEAMRRRPR